MTENDKHSSLLQYRMVYESKFFKVEVLYWFIKSLKVKLLNFVVIQPKQIDSTNQTKMLSEHSQNMKRSSYDQNENQGTLTEKTN